MSDIPVEFPKRNPQAFLAMAAALFNKHAWRTNGLSIVSRLSANFGAGLGSTAAGGTFGLTSRIAHKNLTGKPLLSLAPVYAHYAPSGGTESNTGQDLIVKAALEPNGTPTDQTSPQRVYARASEIYTISRRSVLVADEVPVNTDVNATVFERTGVTTATTAGSTIPRSQIARGSTILWGADTGEGSGTGDNVLSGTITPNVSSGYSAALMLGRTLDGVVAPSVSIIGDSKAVGTDDEGFGPNAGGWAYRACINYPGGNHAIAGEKLRDILTPLGFLTRFELSKFATHILCEYLTNDVLAGDSVATMKANVLAAALRFMRRGQNFIQATVPPLTDSTNGWFDVAGQTVKANETNRRAINSWIRDTGPTGFSAQANAQVASFLNAGWAGFVDPCLGIEVNSSGVLTLNGGFIQPAQSAVIASGTATAGSSTTLTTSGLTANSLKGYVVHIVSGTGAGQVRSINSNSTTVINVGNAFTTVPDATSVFRVFDGNSIDGIHESTGGHTREAASVISKISALMAVA